MTRRGVAASGKTEAKSARQVDGGRLYHPAEVVVGLADRPHEPSADMYERSRIIHHIVQQEWAYQGVRKCYYHCTLLEILSI